MKTIIIIFSSFFFIPFIHSQAQNEIPQSQRTDIIELLEISGISNVATTISTGLASKMIDDMRITYPVLPERAIDIIEEEVVNGLTEAYLPDGVATKMMIEIYSKYYNPSDVEYILNFYKSETGQKLLKLQPIILNDIMKASTKLDEVLVPTILDRVKQRFESEKLFEDMEG